MAVTACPFSSDDFSQLPVRDWTLLVQAVDLWCPELAELYDRFDFLPRWRTDDIMASYAAPGGSVGPHFDQYDVFLVQIEGYRRWQIGTGCDASTPLLSAPNYKSSITFSLLKNGSSALVICSTCRLG